jgi:NADPH-dependent ferric siderophore reductase
MSAKGRVLGALGRLVLREARVAQVIDLASRLRRVVVTGDDLRGVVWIPGDKAQLVLPDRSVRTYTPCSWDAGAGSTSFLVFVHGDAPGAAWGRTVRAGDPVRFLGPQRSLRAEGPCVVVGDETAFGLAEALDAFGVFEVSDHDAAAAFVREGRGVAVPRGDLSAVADQVAAVAAGRALVLAGRASSIQGLRPLLAARGVPWPKQVKAYWADGKRGLD